MPCRRPGATGAERTDESHHYGWWPSLSASSKSNTEQWRFSKHLQQVAECLFGRRGAALAIAGWRLWATPQIMCQPTKTNTGLSASARLIRFTLTRPLVPDVPAHFGARIIHTPYFSHNPAIVPGEIALLQQCVAAARSAPRSGGQPEEASTCGWEIHHLLHSDHHQVGAGISVSNSARPTGGRQRNIPRWRRCAPSWKKKSEVEAALPLVTEDSRLGWEPSMEYMTDRALRWNCSSCKPRFPGFRKAAPAEGKAPQLPWD